VGTRTPPAGSLNDGRRAPLSSDCPVIDRLLPTERLLHSGASTCLGSFACHPADPLFDVEAPSTAHCLVFSRTPVWIRHEGGARYVADPTVATFHNRGRTYQRWRIADEGDRCDWIAYADEVVAEAVSRGRRPAGRDPMWFPAEFAPIPSRIYTRQRCLFDRLHAGTVDGLGVEEEAMLLLDSVLTLVAPSGEGSSLRRAAFDAVQHVRSVIASTPDTTPPLRTLARCAEMTPFELCRAFTRVFGETMSTYRIRLRLLASLERVRAGDPLTEIALAHGFSSHSHFTAAFRAELGVTPRAWRAAATLR
jgi:AraC family transcriptional regulator